MQKNGCVKVGNTDYANQHNPNNKAYKARVANDQVTKKQENLSEELGIQADHDDLHFTGTFPIQYEKEFHVVFLTLIDMKKCGYPQKIIYQIAIQLDVKAGKHKKGDFVT